MESDSQVIDLQTLVECAGNGVAGAQEALDQYHAIAALGGMPEIQSSRLGYKVFDKFALTLPRP
jgi:hypothetical protein